MAFPVAPANGQTAVVNNITYQFSNVGNTWTRILSTANIITANTLVSNGYISAVGNVSGNYILGNGSQLTGIASGTPTLIANGTSNVSVAILNGNVTVGVGGTGNVAVFATTGEYITGIISASGNVTGGNIITAGVMSSTGNATHGNILTGGLISATGTLSVSGNTTVANVSAGNISAGSLNTSGLISATANVTGGNLITVGMISASGNITGSYIIGNGSQLTGLSASYGNANVVANLAALGSNPVSTTGNVTGGNFLTGGLISATGNIYAGNIIVVGGFYDTGDHVVTSTAANANIVLTPTGTGITQNNGAFSASGNITGGNILTSGRISSAGTVTGSSFLGAVVSVTANITGGNILTGGLVSATANIIGGNLLTAGLISATGNIFAGNIIVVGGFYDTGDHLVSSTAANANIILTPTGTGITQNNSAFSASGNVTGGNVLTAGLISAGGTITGTSHLGAVVSVTGAITGTAITGSSLTVSTGNISGGNIVNNNANGVGNIGSATVYFNTVFGKATTAQYADLAELYAADAEYTPGTVLVFGGNNEVTVSTAAADPRVAGVVSTNPAHLMNSVLESKHTVAVALQGRVPTQVVGTVRKGDMMVTAGNGYAQASAAPAMGTVIGKALEDFDGTSGTIEIVVGRL